MRNLAIRLAILGVAALPWATPSNEAAPPQSTTSPARPSYEFTAVANGGTIVGKVRWDGSRPALQPMPINKNADICDRGGKGERPSNRLILDKAGGVKNAVVFLEGIAQGKAFPEGPFSLVQKGCDYDPHIMVVPRKAEVKIGSSDDVLHNVHMFGAASYNIPFPGPVELSKRMRKSGLVRVQCDAGHGWMSAYIHVTDHPYYVITEADGSYRLADVPPGQYKINLWHEHWDITGTTEKEGKVATYTFADPITQSESVEVPAGGTTTVNFTMGSEQ